MNNYNYMQTVKQQPLCKQQQQKMKRKKINSQCLYSNDFIAACVCFIYILVESKITTTITANIVDVDDVHRKKLSTHFLGTLYKGNFLWFLAMRTDSNYSFFVLLQSLSTHTVLSAVSRHNLLSFFCCGALFERKKNNLLYCTKYIRDSPVCVCLYGARTY